jgi:dihydrofolate reductase
MPPLRFSLNITIDGCYDHRVMLADEALHRHAMKNIAQADALIFGRITYQMMEAAWRLETRTVTMPEWTEPFARTIDAARKYVVSRTLESVDWNAELVRGDLRETSNGLRASRGTGCSSAACNAQALTEMRLNDDYEFIVHPRLIGHGPTLFAGLPHIVDLKLVSQKELGSRAVAMRYELRKTWLRGDRDRAYDPSLRSSPGATAPANRSSTARR